MLCQLSSVAWVDYQRVTAFRFRFGANMAVRLAYMELHRLRVWRILPEASGTFYLLCVLSKQKSLPDMCMGVLAIKAWDGSRC